MELKQEGNNISGWMGHSAIPRQINLSWDHNRLSGRIGDDLFGLDTYMEAVDPESRIVALAACISFMWFIESAPKGLKIG